MKDKIVVITGATAGIGRAIVRAFAKNGAFVIVLARDQERIDSTVKETQEMGGKALGISTDVADAEQVMKAAKRIEEEIGPIDIWINNATATVFSEIKDITPAEYKRVTEVTYLGQVYGTMAALKYMWPRNEGTIISVGSALAYRGIPLQAAYCGAKHGIRGFVDSLRVELRYNKKKIRLTSVHLPGHNTPQFSWSKSHINKHPQPVPPIFQPEVAAEAIYWASQNKRREVWVGKPVAATIIMNKLFPWFVDEYLSTMGYESQMMDQEIDVNRPNNLFEPVKGDYKAHGIFDKISKKKSFQFIFEKIPVINALADIIFAIYKVFQMSFSYFKKKLKG